ncbi:MAG: hypothetical protein WBD51_14075, partial [Burkholderiaceae bacterium]
GLCMQCIDFPNGPQTPAGQFRALKWWGRRRTATTIVVMLLTGVAFTVLMYALQKPLERQCETRCHDQGKDYLYSFADGAASPFAANAAPACRCINR